MTSKYHVSIVPKDDTGNWATHDDAMTYDVHVFLDNGQFGWRVDDEILDLPCERSARLLATFLCARHRVRDFDMSWAVAKLPPSSITLDNGWSVPVANDGSFA